MSKLKEILNKLNEGGYEPDKSMSILRNAGFDTFSSPQELPPEKLDVLSGYLEDKVEMIATLYDKENSIRIFELDVEGDVTETLVKEVLSRLERRLRMPILIIDGNYYFIVKERVGRGEFKNIFVSGDLNNFKGLEIKSDDSVVDIQYKLRDDLEHEVEYER